MLASLAKVAYQQPHESITQKTYDAGTKTKSKEYVAKSQEVAYKPFMDSKYLHVSVQF